jgi:HEAT repeat protein
MLSATNSPTPSTADLLRAAASGRIGVDRRLLRSVLDHAAPSEILAFAHEPRDNHRVDLDPLLIDLFRYYQTPEAVDFFMDAIRRVPEDMDESLIQALLPFGEKAVDPMLRLYEELGEEQGSDVAFLLAGLRVHDPRVLAVLLDRLEYDAADGAFCLGLYGDPAARPALEKMLAEIPGEDVELKREVAYALEALEAPAPKYQPESFDILADYPAKELPRFDVLPEAEIIELLASPDPEVRAEAAYSFFNTDLQPNARAALLAVAKADPDAKVRGRAWESLADMSGEDAGREALLAALRDHSKPVVERGGAAVGLYPAADRDDVRRELEALY